MTKYFYDTEFLDNGRTIRLISIGIVAEDGREYYAINSEAPWHEIAVGTSLERNVLLSLPGEVTREYSTYFGELTGRYTFELEENHPNVKPLWEIGINVRNFLERGSSKPELWAYYSPYTHVCLSKLWGSMSNLPSGFPMWTNDIMCIAQWLGLRLEDLPQQEEELHNALADARHVKKMHEFLSLMAL